MRNPLFILFIGGLILQSCNSQSAEELMAEKQELMAASDAKHQAEKAAAGLKVDSSVYELPAKEGVPLAQQETSTYEPSQPKISEERQPSISGPNFRIVVTEEVLIPKSVSFTHYTNGNSTISGATNISFGISQITIRYKNPVGLESEALLEITNDFSREHTCNGLIVRSTVSDGVTKMPLEVFVEKMKVLKIKVGQAVYYNAKPAQSGIYVVKSGDNLDTIAKKLGVSKACLISRNPGLNDNIVPGQNLNYGGC